MIGTCISGPGGQEGQDNGAGRGGGGIEYADQCVIGTTGGGWIVPMDESNITCNYQSKGTYLPLDCTVLTDFHTFCICSASWDS